MDEGAKEASLGRWLGCGCAAAAAAPGFRLAPAGGIDPAVVGANSPSDERRELLEVDLGDSSHDTDEAGALKE